MNKTDLLNLAIGGLGLVGLFVAYDVITSETKQGVKRVPVSPSWATYAESFNNTQSVIL